MGSPAPEDSRLPRQGVGARPSRHSAERPADQALARPHRRQRRAVEERLRLVPELRRQGQRCGVRAESARLLRWLDLHRRPEDRRPHGMGRRDGMATSCRICAHWRSEELRKRMLHPAPLHRKHHGRQGALGRALSLRHRDEVVLRHGGTLGAHRAAQSGCGRLRPSLVRRRQREARRADGNRRGLGGQPQCVDEPAPVLHGGADGLCHLPKRRRTLSRDGRARDRQCPQRRVGRQRRVWRNGAVGDGRERQPLRRVGGDGSRHRPSLRGGVCVGRDDQDHGEPGHEDRCRYRGSF